MKWGVHGWEGGASWIDRSIGSINRIDQSGTHRVTTAQTSGLVSSRGPADSSFSAAAGLSAPLGGKGSTNEAAALLPTAIPLAALAAVRWMIGWKNGLR